jgi:hypothetical protein
LQWKHKNAFCVYCWVIRHCQQYKSTECRKTKPLRRIYIAGDNATYSGRHVIFPTYLSEFVAWGSVVVKALRY